MQSAPPFDSTRRPSVLAGLLVLLLVTTAGCGGNEVPASVPPPGSDGSEPVEGTNFASGYRYLFDMTSPANDNFAITDRAVYLYFWPDTAHINFRLQNRLGTPIKILWDECRYTTTEGITYPTIHRDITYENRNRPQGFTTVLGLEQYNDWLAPDELLESPAAASGGDLPLLFPTDAQAMSYRGKRFYLDFVLEIDNIRTVYNLAFEIRNVSPPE